MSQAAPNVSGLPSHRANPTHQTMREIPRATAPGVPALVLGVGGIPALIAMVIYAGFHGIVPLVVFGVLALLFDLFCLPGLFSVQPNEARVLTLFGRYVGSVRETGLRWANPFYSKRRVSLRVRNFESEKLKVNDKDGNPVDIAAVVVWKVVDTAEALFHVDNYENFVHVQSESALRNMASHYAYDAHQEGEVALRSHTGEIAEKLKSEIQERLAQAGVEVVEARITHLAYAQEIAHAMLQRQQASAVIAARSKIVDGAVGMVEMALAQLEAKKIVELDGERRAAMVSNLLVVLCSEHSSSPVLNVGTLYS
jgi:regulator of protease activity HflC (stomatin/prohibitin superfamily)